MSLGKTEKILKEAFIMKKLIIFMLFLTSIVTFGGLGGVTQIGDYCIWEKKSQIYAKAGDDNLDVEIYDAKCVINKLDYIFSRGEGTEDFHYESYGGKIFDVPILFFYLDKKVNLSKIRRIEFGEGVKIEGSAHTGRLHFGDVTKYSISGNTLKILENINDY